MQKLAGALGSLGPSCRRSKRRTSCWAVMSTGAPALDAPKRKASFDSAIQLRALVRGSTKRLLSKAGFAGAAGQAGRFAGSPDMTPEGIDRLVIMPDNQLKNAFDILIAVCVMFTSVAMPLKCARARPRLAHAQLSQSHSSRRRLTFLIRFPVWWEMTVNALFMLDVVLQARSRAQPGAPRLGSQPASRRAQFFHGYMHLGFPVLDLRMVAKRYLFSCARPAPVAPAARAAPLRAFGARRVPDRPGGELAVGRDGDGQQLARRAAALQERAPAAHQAADEDVEVRNGPPVAAQPARRRAPPRRRRARLQHHRAVAC